MRIQLNIYLTATLAIFVFYIGALIKKRVKLFEKYCIPEPVIGGLLFSVFTLVLNLTGILTIETDITIQNVFMTLFFTSIGFTASLRLLKKGGVQVIMFTLVTAVLIFLQNLMGVNLASLLGLEPLLGLCVGSIPMVGGHATSSAFGPMLEGSYGIAGASSVSAAAATFGLIMGGLIGGPVAKRRLTKHGLSSGTDAVTSAINEFTEEKTYNKASANDLFHAICMLFIAAGFGVIISELLEMTGLSFPSYIGAMLAAAIIRNISDATKMFVIVEDLISHLGSISLTIFMSMALLNLKLWELVELAGPMLLLLAAQTVLMALFAYYIYFNIMGRDYEAAVMSSAACGFGMGATPNAIANMQALTTIYGAAPRAFFVVPLVGSLFVDFINSFIITVFINILG